MRSILLSRQCVRELLEKGETQIVRDRRYRPASSYRGEHNIDGIFAVKETYGCYAMDIPESNAAYYLYRADYPDNANGYWYEPEHIHFCDFPKWRSAASMPPEAARLFVRVTQRTEKPVPDKWNERVSACITLTLVEKEDLHDGSRMG